MSVPSDPTSAPSLSPVPRTNIPPDQPSPPRSVPQRRSLWVGLVAFVLGIVTLALAVFFIPTIKNAALDVLKTGNPANPSANTIGTDPTTVASAQSEAAAAFQDNLYIARWFADCSKFAKIEDMPQKLIIWVEPYHVKWKNAGDANADRTPTPQQFQVAQLSQTLYRQRIAGAGTVHDAYIFSEWMQASLILLGFLTTIVVTLSTSPEYGRDGTPRSGRLRFFAIVLPVLGTAVAAFNAFYNPAQQYVGTKRTLASFAQLHNQIATEVVTMGCDDSGGKISQWIKHYQDIQSFESTTGQQQSGTAESSTTAIEPTPTH